jgi:Fe2+ or Zn2+ uptake regulation protein
MIKHELPTTEQRILVKDILEECDRRLKVADFELNDLSPEGKTLLFSSVYRQLINEH